MRIIHPIRVLFGTVFVLHLALAAAADPATPPVSAGDLADLSLEDLMDLEVTSVSKKAERLFDSPAAIYVITREDLRRSGATSIPEALRMVPGMQVAQISSNRWAVSARGFNSEFANKLLVLIDGRSVYTPLFSGVFWDVQDVMLEDIERIEVIRGPGATLWGANAVNGVINVITRSSAETQGGLLVAGGGSEERHFGGVRWGAPLGTKAHFRVYAKHFDRESFVDSSGSDAEDGWNASRGGFRMDWEPSQHDMVTFQGDFYRGDVGERHFMVDSLVPASRTIHAEDIDIEGWNTLGRWTHGFENGSEASLQIYADRTKRDIEFASEVRDTLDLDFQHRFAVSDRNEMVWGAGYRWTRDRTDGSTTVAFDPDSRIDDLWSAFLQDEITLIEDRLSLTLGSKIEYNDYTGFEYQPSGRLLLKPHEHHSLWGSVSRAVRTPSRADADVILVQDVVDPPGPLVSQVTQLTGTDDYKAERMVAYELGYRFNPNTKVSADVATFFNKYHDLRSIELLGLDFLAVPGGVVALNEFDNKFDGSAWGIEFAGRWEATPWWQISASYAYTKIHLHSRGSVDPLSEEDAEGSTPTHTLHLRSFIDLPGAFEFDTLAYWVENLPQEGVSSYVRLDTRLGWRVRDGLSLSLVGQNLLDSRHDEFGDTTLWPRSEVERGFYGKVEWEF